VLFLFPLYDRSRSWGPATSMAPCRGAAWAYRNPLAFAAHGPN